MSMRATCVRLLMALLVMGFVAGCTNNAADLHQWVAKEKAKKGPPLPPLPVVKTFETFVYKDQAKRDPFGSATGSGGQSSNSANGPHPDQNRPKQPLEYFTLDSLAMVGTIGTDGHMVVLIQDPNKKIYRVRVNQYMGQNYGRVTDIHQDRVDLVELVPNGDGGWRERKASIALSLQ